VNVLKLDRVPLLQSHCELLEQVGGLSGVSCDNGLPPSQFLDQLNCLVVPCTGCFNGHWSEDVSCGELAVFVGLVGGGKAVSMAVLLTWASAYVSGTVTSHASVLPLNHGRIMVPSGRLPSCLRIPRYSFESTDAMCDIYNFTAKDLVSSSMSRIKHFIYRTLIYTTV